jgi:hypothetical protein
MRILIATDGSEYSKGALDKCIAFFTHSKATEIKVVSVYENAYATIATEPFMPQPGYSEELIEASRKLAEGFTTSATAFLTERFNGNAPKITSEVLDGIPADRSEGGRLERRPHRRRVTWTGFLGQDAGFGFRCCCPPCSVLGTCSS